MKTNNPLSRKDNIVVQELDGEVLIYDLNKNKAFCLNETSALIWQLCDGNRSVAAITQELSNKFNTPANEDLVWLALDQLKKEKLVENETPAPTTFAGLSRRDVIKKVGLGSMIALPIVAGLVVPRPAHAQSCSGVCACNTDNQPLNGPCGSMGAGTPCAITTCQCFHSSPANSGSTAGFCA